MRVAARHRPSGRMIGLPSRVADMQYPEWIWHNGTIKPWAEATTHVMSHALHYGSSVFEGIRSYDTPDGPPIFRHSDHNRRRFAPRSEAHRGGKEGCREGIMRGAR